MANFKQFYKKEFFAKPGDTAHTAKWDSCVEAVKRKGGGANAYAVCTAALGDDTLKSMVPGAEFEAKMQEYISTLRISSGVKEKAVDTAYAGGTPKSDLARQDLEGSTEKSRVVRADSLKNGDTVVYRGDKHKVSDVERGGKEVMVYFSDGQSVELSTSDKVEIEKVMEGEFVYIPVGSTYTRGKVLQQFEDGSVEIATDEGIVVLPWDEICKDGSEHDLTIEINNGSDKSQVTKMTLRAGDVLMYHRHGDTRMVEGEVVSASGSGWLVMPEDGKVHYENVEPSQIAGYRFKSIPEAEKAMEYLKGTMVNTPGVFVPHEDVLTELMSKFPLTQMAAGTLLGAFLGSNLGKAAEDMEEAKEDAKDVETKSEANALANRIIAIQQKKQKAALKERAPEQTTSKAFRAHWARANKR
jgi:hypothetical protein